eukprot:2166971-Rhodomonas_salina.1
MLTAGLAVGLSVAPETAPPWHLAAGGCHLHARGCRGAIRVNCQGELDCSVVGLSAIDSALDKVESDLGLRMPISPAPPTASHLKMLESDQLKVFQETAAMMQKQTSSSIEEDPGKKHLLEAEMEELRRAREMGQKQQELFNSLFSIDEQLDSAAHESAKRIAQLQQKMVLLQKKIQEIETPRDDSFDNMYAPLNEPGHRHLSGVVVR